MLRIRDAQVPVQSGPYAANGSPGGWVVPKVMAPMRFATKSGVPYVGWVDPATEPTFIVPPCSRRP